MSADDVLGMNRRNAHIETVNAPAAMELVDDKARTKTVLRARGIPVPPTLAHVRDARDAKALLADGLTDEWVCKPNRSRGGMGILISGGRDGSVDGWRSLGGDVITRRDVRLHVRRILDGEFSLGGSDTALFEPLLVPHRTLAGLAAAGMPDVRVLCDGSEPVAAMLRLPTERSDGRANLHAGGVGAAVDLATGELHGGLVDREPVDEHPDTGASLHGVAVPHWDEVLAASVRCADATGLRFLGVDVVIDELRGPAVLEVNARPGLEIQNVVGRGLRDVTRGATAHGEEPVPGSWALFEA